MIKKLVDSDFETVELQHVPMEFSRDMDEIGRFQWGKLIRLPILIARIWKVRFQGNCATLYYPPGGESNTAILRDIAVLLTCRILFSEVIFHAHAGGFTDIVKQAPWPVRCLALRAYRKPDLFIQLTNMSPPDGAVIRAKRIVSLPCGLPDDAARYAGPSGRAENSSNIRLLFVGVVSRSKGVMVLLEACARLKVKDVTFHLRIIGRFHSPEFEAECLAFIQDHDLVQEVEFLGVRTGDDKWEEYCATDIFCFPSHFESENQPLVILEAMQFGLPSVATDWRSISTMVEDGQTGYIVPTEDSKALAERITYLVRHPELRRKLGQNARQAFLEKYTDAVWRSQIETMLCGAT